LRPAFIESVAQQNATSQRDLAYSNARPAKRHLKNTILKAFALSCHQRYNTRELDQKRQVPVAGILKGQSFKQSRLSGAWSAKDNAPVYEPADRPGAERNLGCSVLLCVLMVALESFVQIVVNCAKAALQQAHI
jgi:hypothetical protein